jgi:transposase-like protein
MRPRLNASSARPELSWQSRAAGHHVDKNPVFSAALAALKAEITLPRRVRLRQCKYLNNVAEQDHRTVKKWTWLAKRAWFAGYGVAGVAGD